MSILQHSLASLGSPTAPSPPLVSALAVFSALVHTTLVAPSLPPPPLLQQLSPFMLTVGSYHLSTFLGRGQAGTVYLGEDDAGTPLFAVKAIFLPGAVGVGTS